MTHTSIKIFKDIVSAEDLEIGFAFYKGKIVSRSTFLQHVAAVSGNLADSRYLINLCEDRYLFMVVFISCLIRKQVSLLPPSRVELEIENLKQEYRDCSCISDEDITLELSDKSEKKSVLDILVPEVELDQLACIVFTSGSTGQPKANEKKWGALLSSSRLVAKTLGLEKAQQYQMVTTVPAQHMFGFEMSIMLPLVSGALIHSGKPFFPQEVCHSLSQVSVPRILITTPMHLKACVEASLDWPEIDFVLSSTATLEEGLAHDAGFELKTKVKEIYGCSEAGAIASRVLSESVYWNLLPGYRIQKKLSVFELNLPEENNDIILHDNFEFNAEGQFVLQGRETDMIKIAGKRGSLGDLRNKICSIPGVHDAVFFMPYADAVKGRTAALVVAKGIDVDKILKLLAKKIDPAFLPRPLIKVNNIPYNEIGKISRNKLKERLQQYKNKSGKLSECLGE